MKNKLFKKIVSVMGGRYYFNSFYKINTGKTDWEGKKCCLTLSFDCDYKKDVLFLPSLLNTLSGFSFKASFACVGKLVEKYPGEHKKIIENGHEIINHTDSHPDNEYLNKEQKFNELTREQKRAEIEKCHNICKNILGYCPTGFRTPHFGNLHTPDVYGILKELGYKYSSSTVAVETTNNGLPFIDDGIIEFPVSTCPKHPFAVFDTWHSLERGNGKHKNRGEFYGLFRELIELGIKTNSYINLYFDPQDLENSEDFKEMLEYLKKMENDILIINYKELCRTMKSKIK